MRARLYKPTSSWRVYRARKRLTTARRYSGTRAWLHMTDHKPQHSGNIDDTTRNH